MNTNQKTDFNILKKKPKKTISELQKTKSEERA